MKCIRAHAAMHDITCMVLQAPLLTLEGHTDYVRCGATSPASGDLWYKVLPLSPCQNIKGIFVALVGNHLTQNPYQTISICTYYILCDVAVLVINMKAY
jgi:hypothetical protein